MSNLLGHMLLQFFRLSSPSPGGLERQGKHAGGGGRAGERCTTERWSTAGVCWLEGMAGMQPDLLPLSLPSNYLDISVLVTTVHNMMLLIPLKHTPDLMPLCMP